MNMKLFKKKEVMRKEIEDNNKANDIDSSTE